MFFGTISPSSTCSTTTIVIAMTNDTVCSTASGMPSRCERLLQQVRHRGLADPAEQDRADGDAQLRAGQHQRQVLAGPDHGDRAVLALFGQGLQPVAARGDQRELRADEERVGGQQQHGRAARRRCRPSASSFVVRCGPASVSSSRSIRRPSIRTTVASQRHRVLERRVGIERPQLHRLAVFRNVAQLLQHQPADGLVFALGRPEAGRARPPRRCAAAPTPASRGPPAPRRGGSRRARRERRRRSPRSGPRPSPCPRCRRTRRPPARSATRWRGSAPSRRRRPGSTAPWRPACASVGQPGLRPRGVRHLEDLFDVDDADGLVEVALHDRETREARL